MEIQGFENYLLYEDGRVFNTTKMRQKKPTISKTKCGYKRYTISFGKNKKAKTFLLSRLLMKHYKPDEWNEDLQVDHINRNSLDNRLENLRMVTPSQNGHNTGIRKDNTSGLKNICFTKRKGNDRWVYQKNVNKKRISKYFKTLEEAIKFKEDYESTLNIF